MTALLVDGTLVLAGHRAGQLDLYSGYAVIPGVVIADGSTESGL
ncbi:MAG: hypothetical protein ABIQ18_21675 [Umezawaea sp.]